MNTLGISKQGYREIKNLGWDGFRFSGSIILLLNGPFTLFFSTTVGGPFSLEGCIVTRCGEWVLCIVNIYHI